MYMQFCKVIYHTIIPFSHSFGNQLPTNELKKRQKNEPLDKHTQPNLLQTSCFFYYISWNTYSLQFSLKRCLAPCTMLKHAQILQYKGVRLKHSVCVIADTERLKTMSMFTCVLTAGSLYTNICLTAIYKHCFIRKTPLNFCLPSLTMQTCIYMCSVFKRLCKQVSVNFNSVTVCGVCVTACLRLCVKAWNLSLAALLIQHRRWMNPEWTEGKPTVWAVNKRWEQYRTEPYWAPGSTYPSYI